MDTARKNLCIRCGVWLALAQPENQFIAICGYCSSKCQNAALADFTTIVEQEMYRMESRFPPQGHPAWSTYAQINEASGSLLPCVPPCAGEYWYDNCWGSHDEDRNPMRLTIEPHEDGMHITAAEGAPLDEPTNKPIEGYNGFWAPLDWENVEAKPVVVPQSAEPEMSSGFQRC